MPRLSVIMPARNAAVHIRSAVLSTLRAMPADAELVVLDDASTDNTQAVLAAIVDRRLRILHLPDQQGVSRGLNYLLAQTDSEFVGRMDADDVCFPWRFRLQRKRITSSDFTFTSTIFITERGVPVRPDMPGYFSDRATPLHLLLGNVLVHSTMFARRSSIDLLGGYSSVPAEDYDLWLRAASVGMQVSRSAVPGVGYRRHPNQITASEGWRSQVKNDQDVARSYYQLLERELGPHSSLADPEHSIGIFAAAERHGLDSFNRMLKARARELPMIEREILNVRRRKVVAALRSLYAVA
jgi:glycosyltransferase involved in cell wall biosynthesis